MSGISAIIENNKKPSKEISSINDKFNKKLLERGTE